MRELEKFVSDSEAKSSMGTTFMVLSYIFGGMILAGLLLWSYTKSDVLFTCIFSGIMVVYSLSIVIIVASIRSKLTPLQFKLLMTASLFMMVLCVSVLIIYIIRAIDNSKSKMMPPPRPPPSSYDDE